MTAERFTLDTDVLVYAADLDSGRKRQRALAILDRARDLDCVLTLQALGEFFLITTRKGTMKRSDSLALVDDWSTMFPTVAASVQTLREGNAAAASVRVGIWDAILLATASGAGCRTVLSEYLRDGMRYKGMVVRNPFRGAALPKEIERLFCGA